MAPNILNQLSPAELNFLHSSLLLTPPIRPDARTPTQFRPLVAETNILPGTNGSARICFADGTEAIVGIKAEVERHAPIGEVPLFQDQSKGIQQQGEDHYASDRWVHLNIEIQEYREDDPLPVFLSAMLHESLVAGGELARKLVINATWHWKLYIDVLLLSPPLSYPVPLLSLTIHLALLSCRLAALKSERDEDPFFNDDWEASKFVYPTTQNLRPAVTLLVAAIGPNIFFDPSQDEIAVADALLAVSVSRNQETSTLRLLSVRVVDPPARLTSIGVSDEKVVSATGADHPEQLNLDILSASQSTGNDKEGLWRPRIGGMSRKLISNAIRMSLMKDGVGHEVLEALQSFQ